MRKRGNSVQERRWVTQCRKSRQRQTSELVTCSRENIGLKNKPRTIIFKGGIFT